jgi:hypothetical protein
VHGLREPSRRPWKGTAGSRSRGVGRWKFSKGWTQGVQASGTLTSCHLPEGLKVEFLGRVVPFKHLG